MNLQLMASLAWLLIGHGDGDLVQNPTDCTHRYRCAAVGRNLGGECCGDWADDRTPAHGPLWRICVAADLPNWHRNPLSALTAWSLPKKGEG
jgi:hypothetical protein